MSHTLLQKHTLIPGSETSVHDGTLLGVKHNQNMQLDCLSCVSVEILHQDVQKVLKLKYPDIAHIQLTKTASVNGVTYREGMVAVCGSTGGLPDFAEVVQMVVLEGNLSFIVKEFGDWYMEHFRAFELCPTSQVSLIQLGALVDQYPLADYRIGGRRMVTLKRFIHIQGQITLNHVVLMCSSVYSFFKYLFIFLFHI